VATLAEVFVLALQQHRAGNLRQAEELCQRILQAAPGHADAHHLLGVLAYQIGRYEQAVLSIHRAITLNPAVASCHTNLGLAQEALGNIEEAVANYQQALRLEPNAAEAHSNLGNALRQQGKLKEAVVHCRQALRLRPDFPQACNNLGNALLAQGKLEEAVSCFQQALQFNPNFAEACNNLGTALTAQNKPDEGIRWYREALRLKSNYPQAHYNLGIALERLEKVDEASRCYREALRLKPDFAEACRQLAMALFSQDKVDESISSFQEALRLDPDNAEVHTNLGNAFGRQDKPDEAIRCHRQALRLNPDCAEAHTNLGNVLARQDRLDEAIGCHRQALRVLPDFVPAWTNLGSVRAQKRQFDEALTCYEHALTHDASHVQTHFNRALLWLLLGNWAQGWPEYEWRWQTKGYGRYAFRQPRWDGSPLTGRTIFVFAEQGLGDTLQFIRYLPWVQERGGRVILQCQPRLMPLLAGAGGIDRLVAAGAPFPAFDVYAPLLDLPGLFHTSPENVPAAVPYLHADAGLVEHWKSAMCEVRGATSEEVPLTSHIAHRTSHFLVGIAWQGTSTYRGDGQRSIPLTNFAALARVPGVQLVSLQKGPGADQLRSLAGQLPVLDLGSRLDEASGAFMDTAALMMNLDLVISSDTSLPHLAGALGVPVWVALSQVPDWRWLLEREDSPWYPTMRLFRQTRYGQWEDVFERLAQELQNLVTLRRNNYRAHRGGSVRSGLGVPAGGQLAPGRAVVPADPSGRPRPS